jgi:hypothetical protein
MRQYKNYTDEDIIKYCKEVSSMRQLLKKLNLNCTGGNYDNMKKKLQRLNLNCNHWTGQGWNKGQQLKNWGDYTRAVRMKPHIIKERGHCCENCNNTHWLNQLIPLEIEHVDGNRTNNELSNLKLLCCNCHAQTPTWRGRKKK